MPAQPSGVGLQGLRGLLVRRVTDRLPARAAMARVPSSIMWAARITWYTQAACGQYVHRPARHSAAGCSRAGTGAMRRVLSECRTSARRDAGAVGPENGLHLEVTPAIFEHQQVSPHCPAFHGAARRARAQPPWPRREGVRLSRRRLPSHADVFQSPRTAARGQLPQRSRRGATPAAGNRPCPDDPPNRRGHQRGR